MLSRHVLAKNCKCRFQFLACLTLGAVPVPSSPLLTAPEVYRIADELEPTFTIFGQDMPAQHNLPGQILTAADFLSLQDHAAVDPVLLSADTLAYIIYTSGTSGQPRAVMHAHRAVWARRMMWDGWYGLTSQDRMLHAGAFNWTYTLGTGLLDPWAIGATAMVYTGPNDRTVWAKIAAQNEPTLFAAAPGVYRQILSTPVHNSFSSLRHALSAGEKLPNSVHDAWKSATNKPIHEAFGMTEASTFISSSPTNPASQGALGSAQRGRKIAVLGASGPVPINTPGVLALHRSDAGLMLGYRNQPTETEEKFQGDWFLTGDTVTMHETGHITYLGRADDMLNAGGYRVSPLEIETVLNLHPAVTESAAASVEIKPDTFVIAAFYVVSKPVSHQELEKHCAQRLAKYKMPRIYVATDALPKGANNKLKRMDLRNWTPKP